MASSSSQNRRFVVRVDALKGQQWQRPISSKECTYLHAYCRLLLVDRRISERRRALFLGVYLITKILSMEVPMAAMKEMTTTKKMKRSIEMEPESFS